MESTKLHHLPGEKGLQTRIAQCFGAFASGFIYFSFVGNERTLRRELVWRALFLPPACFLVSFLTSAGKRGLFSGNDCIYYARLRKW